MSKTNKELAVEITIEMIKATPSLVFKQNSVSDGIRNGYDLNSVKSIVKGLYETLNEIDMPAGQKVRT